MTDEQVLIVALTVTSTLAAGLAVDRDVVATTIGRGPMVLVVAASVLALPAFAWVLCRALDIGAAGIGLLVAAAAPGGSTGPLLAVVAGGDPGTAARLFVVTTVLGTATAIGVTFGLGVFDPLHLARASLLVTTAALLPLVVGLVLRRRRPHLARWLAPRSARLGLVLLLATVVLLAVRHGHETAAIDLGVASLLVLASFAPAALVRERATRIAVGQVGAVRNLGLSLLVLAALDAPPRATLAVLGYGLVMYVVTIAIAIVARAVAPHPEIA